MASVAPIAVTNLLAHLPLAVGDELITVLADRPGVRFERIVSTGQVTPIDQPYDQDHDEWVLVLAGAARLWLDGSGEVSLGSGDSLMIPAHTRHRVAWTDPNRPTVWLAVHFAPLDGDDAG